MTFWILGVFCGANFLKIDRRLRPLACLELLDPDFDLNRVALVLFLRFLLSPFESGSSTLIAKET